MASYSPAGATPRLVEKKKSRARRLLARERGRPTGAGDGNRTRLDDVGNVAWHLATSPAHGCRKNVRPRRSAFAVPCREAVTLARPSDRRGSNPESNAWKACRPPWPSVAWSLSPVLPRLVLATKGGSTAASERRSPRRLPPPVDPDTNGGAMLMDAGVVEKQGVEP